MDALKGCTTNVQTIKEVDTTPLRLYAYEGPAISSAHHVAATAANLREGGAICAAAGDRLWVFNDVEEELLERMGSGFQLELQGKMAEHSQVVANGQSAVLAFIDALEGSVSVALSRANNALKISAWAWLLSDTTRRRSMMIRMRCQISEDSKKVTIATHVQRSTVTKEVNGGPRPSRIVLAPSGVLARWFTTGENPNHQIRSEGSPTVLRNESWMDSVRKGLATEGIELSKDTTWVDLVPVGMEQAVSWPESLCFSDLGTNNTEPSSENERHDWQRWFQCADLQSFDDPLSFAEEWSTTFSNLEAAVDVGHGPSHDDSAMEDASNAQPYPGNATFDVTSPPLTNRPDLQALHGIYPTPPDGLAAHIGTQGHQHPDNMSMLPNGDAVNPPAFTPSDPPPENNMSLFEGAPDIDSEAVPRNHSIVSSIGPNAPDWNRGSSDDLFGDMDDGEYGKEEVGDADFNFFDEPDAVPSTTSMGPPPPTVPSIDHMESEPQPGALQIAEPAVVSEAVQDENMQDLPSTDNLSQSNEIQPASIASPDGRDSYAPLTSDVRDEHSSPMKSPAPTHYTEVVKPLSPFGIREALLPPPIPASASNMQTATERERRRSSFGPLVFNQGGTFAPKSSSYDYSDYKPEDRKPSYDLGPTHVPLTAISESSGSPDSTSSFAEAASEDEVETDSDDESVSTISNHQAASHLKLETGTPDTKKRKRTADIPDTSAYCGPKIPGDSQSRRALHEHSTQTKATSGRMQDVLSKLLGKDSAHNAMRPELGQLGTSDYDAVAGQQTMQSVRPESQAISIYDNPVSKNVVAGYESAHMDIMLTYPELKYEDLVLVSQLVADQAVTVTDTIAQELDVLRPHADDLHDQQRALLDEVTASLKVMLPTTDACDIPSLTLVREPLPVQRPPPAQPPPNTATQARHPPRPPPRVDPATALGPDILQLTASYIRARRGENTWEMAPTALDFWETLGLGPVSGAKDVRYYCLAPDSEMLVRPINSFLQNLKAAYEGCKFGSMTTGTDFAGESPTDDLDTGATYPVAFDGSTEAPMIALMQAYWESSAQLGAKLAFVAADDPGRTFVVSMINPISPARRNEWLSANQHLCACFLRLSKAYRNAVAHVSSADLKSASQPTMSDVDFKILPIALVASPSSIVVPTAQQMSLLARELYDRLPPGSSEANDSSPLSNAAAPSVEIVAPLPKRINFQLTSDPPTDLLHEASVLHVAYATSEDGEWMSVIWHDNTGRYASSSAFCLRGRSFAEVALEVWKRTTELIKAREVIWRIFIVTSGADGVEVSRANCWKDTIAQFTERRQLLSVTLLHFQPTLALSILPPLDTAAPGQPGQAPGSSVPTPVSTPQPGSGPAGATTSPDATATGQAPGTAPPTPAPSEAASGILEADPEAHLVEVEDETWAMLLDRDVAAALRPAPSFPIRPPLLQQQPTIPALAHGLLIKRGASASASEPHNPQRRPYPSAGASLIWTLRVRPRSSQQERANVDEGSARHAEVMLREVLGMFRNLGLLSRVKGLDGRGLVPVHVAAAVKGAEGLVGLLGGGRGERG